jgi:hypothetical protein
MLIVFIVMISITNALSYDVPILKIEKKRILNLSGSGEP